MSDTKKDKNQDGNNPDTEDEHKIRITVDRTSAEEELQKKLEEERKERDKVNKELEEATKKLQDMQTEGTEKVSEFEEEKKKLQGEIDEYKGKLTEIAKNEFNRRKASYIDRFKEAGFPEEKITEMDEMLKAPADLDNAEMYLTIYQEMMAKALKEREDEEQKKQKTNQDQEQKDAKAAADAQQKRGGGVVNLDQKGQKDMVYDSYREGIDDLYAQQASTDPKVSDKAKRTLDALWSKVVPTLRKEMKAFAVAECPRCGGGILEGEVCPYCGFDPSTYIQKGSIWG